MPTTHSADPTRLREAESNCQFSNKSKAVLLFRYYKQKENIPEGDWFKVLRDHKHKRVAWVHSTDILYGSTTPKPVTQFKDELKKHINDDGWREWFNLEREVGVYVDWDGQWRSPTTINPALFSGSTVRLQLLGL